MKGLIKFRSSQQKAIQDLSTSVEALARTHRRLHQLLFRLDPARRWPELKRFKYIPDPPYVTFYTRSYTQTVEQRVQRRRERSRAASKRHYHRLRFLVKSLTHEQTFYCQNIYQMNLEAKDLMSRKWEEERHELAEALVSLAHFSH